MSYVDGFVVPVPTKNLEAYFAIARKAGKVWIEHGALEYDECVADDVKPGKRTSFPQSVKLKADETVVFSWIVYKSRAHRDRVNQEGDERRTHRRDGAGNRCRSTASACSLAASRPRSRFEAMRQSNPRKSVTRFSVRNCDETKSVSGSAGAMKR